MVKRKRLLGSVILLTLAGSSAIWVSSGCSPTPPVTGELRTTEERSRELLAMSAEEASQIPEIDPRLTRQLNLAEMQINRGWKSEAIKTLSACRQTLSSPEAAVLNEHARLSGWVSVSELCRQAGDDEGAKSACNSAVADLQKLPDPAKRCQYVMGVANELQYTQGIDAAANMLASAGPWTKNIDNVQQRRLAVISFATALFNLDAYPQGQQMLRQEGDAGWRSDMLAQLAMRPAPMEAKTAQRSRAPQAVVSSVSERAADSAPQPADHYFGKNLQYREVYQNQKTANVKEK